MWTLAIHALLAAAPPAETKAFLDRNCTACHRPGTPPAGIDLTSLDFDLDDAETTRRWIRVHDAVRNGSMPPGGKGVAEPARSAFLNTVARPLIDHQSTKAASQGRSVLRRLNRYEYENTVRELLGAPWLQLRDSLPEDGLVARFNKSGQALDISHVQMARYMEAAEQSLRLALDSAAATPKVERHYARDQFRFQRRMRYDQFNGSPERANIPLVGYETVPEIIENRDAPFSVGPADPKTRELEAMGVPASNFNGSEYYWDKYKAPVGGRYKLRISSYSIWIHTTYFQRGGFSHWRPNRKSSEKGRTVEPVTIYALRPGGERRKLGSFDVTPEPAVYEIEGDLLPGEMILPDAARLFRSRPGFVGSPDATEAGMPGVAFRWMEAEGPLRGPKVDLVEGEPERLLRDFMTRAYRRPVREAEFARYRKILGDRLSQGKKEALISAYTAVLCSPGFLYLDEEPGALKPHALAARLSYFLWNSPPDRELLGLAAKGTLGEPGVLKAQTERLLSDPRSRRFTDAFLDYWLDLRKLPDTTPDVTLYPEYYLDDLLTESALGETQSFFHHLIERNLPARALIDADFAMLNSHLARHYGLPKVEGVQLRKTALPPDSVRGGLLTQASVLKITANGTTTSPVLRGVWILERIIGEPPPPPPPSVPGLEPDTRGATTIREQLEKHRAVASCAACHAKIDPPGFALEGFDVLGGERTRYRSTDEGEPVAGLGKNGHAFAFKLSKPVDASGRLATGEEFAGIRDFKKLLLKDERKIARNMVAQFVSYATGAPPSFADRAEIDRLTGAAAEEEYGLRSLIHRVVQSKLFTHK